MTNLLDLAVEAQGGLTRWREINSIDFKLSIASCVWRLKGLPPLRDVSLRVDPRAPLTIVSAFTAGRRGYFTTDRVWIEDHNGSVVEEREHPRRSFEGHDLMTPWNRLHELYFVGYTLWNYMVTPFIFTEPGFKTKEIEPYEELGEIWRRLYVSYPDNVPTHCKEQIIYFNRAGVLRRLDYGVDVFQGRVAHYCFDHQNFGGLIIPTLSRVVSRVDSKPLLSGPTMMLFQIDEVVVA